MQRIVQAYATYDRISNNKGCDNPLLRGRKHPAFVNVHWSKGTMTQRVQNQSQSFVSKLDIWHGNWC